MARLQRERRLNLLAAETRGAALHHNASALLRSFYEEAGFAGTDRPDSRTIELSADLGLK